jgi:fibronectin type 3 domain-containing protein
MIGIRYNTGILSISLILIFILSTMPSSVSEPNHANIKINDDTTTKNQWYTDIDIDINNRAHVVWNDRRDDTLSVYYANSETGGLSFSENIKIADVEVDDLTEVLKSGPVVATDESGFVFIAYYSLNNGNYDIVLVRSDNNGASFSERGALPDPDSTNQMAMDMIATGANTVYLTWMDYKPDDSRILFAKSTDGGETFGAAVSVSDGTGIALHPRMAVDPNGQIHIVWQDPRDGGFNIYYAFSDDGGSTFSTDKMIAGSAATNQTEPAIAAGGDGSLYVTFSNSWINESDVIFMRSTDGGATWSGNIQLNDDIVNTTQKTSRIAVDGKGKIYVVWEDNRSHRGDIYYDIYTTNSTDGGLTFGINEKVNNDPYKNVHHLVTDHIWTDLAVDSTDRIYVVWVDNREKNYDVYLAHLPLGAHSDTIPPAISHTPVSSGTELRPIEITATITDNVGVTGTMFSYRIAGDVAYKSFSMSSDGDTYTAEIPGTFVSTAGVEYYIEATDGINTVTHPASNPADAPHVIAVTTLQPPPTFHAEPGDEKVKLSWGKLEGVEGYNLYKSESADSDFSLVSLVSIKTTTFEDTQVENGKTYYYYVKSVDENGAESVASEMREVTPEEEGSGQLNNIFALILVIMVILIIVIVIYVMRLMKIKGNQ